MNIHSERKDKPSGDRILEIYRKILEKHRLYGVPFSYAIKSFELKSWSYVREKALKIMLDRHK